VITSKLTSKAQTTIPQPVRAALGVTEGDELAYTIEDGRVVLTKAPPPPRLSWRSYPGPIRDVLGVGLEGR